MRYIGIFLIAILSLTSIPAAGPAVADWPFYGHDPGGQRFSPLDTINRANVASLKVAWTFRTGDAYSPPRGRPTAFESTPLYIDGVLYLTTSLGRVIALDPVSGTEKWSSDSKLPKDMGYGDFANRGVSAWTGSKTGLKLFLATIDARLISIDATACKPTQRFGDNGIVNLRTGLRIPVPEGRFADYEETSPPAIVGNTVIVGSGIADNNRADEPLGEVRGYDAATGKLKWTWDPMQQHPKTGAANAWSVIAADPARKLVFVPTGSASPDYYGGERSDDNRWANSLVAMIRSSGRIERLNSGGVPIGLFVDARYTSGKLQMPPGSRLVIFTDGMTDAQNVVEEEFGDERLMDCCRTIAPGIDAKGVADTLMRTVAQFSVGTEQFDDTTVVVLDVNPLGNTKGTVASAAEAQSRPLLDICVTLPS